MFKIVRVHLLSTNRYKNQALLLESMLREVATNNDEYIQSTLRKLGVEITGTSIVPNADKALDKIRKLRGEGIDPLVLAGSSFSGNECSCEFMTRATRYGHVVLYTAKDRLNPQQKQAAQSNRITHIVKSNEDFASPVAFFKKVVYPALLQYTKD